jgi:hypothetical protein
MVKNKGEGPPLLHSDAGKLAMTGGEPITMANVGMSFSSTLFETKSIGVTSGTS